MKLLVMFNIPGKFLIWLMIYLGHKIGENFSFCFSCFRKCNIYFWWVKINGENRQHNCVVSECEDSESDSIGVLTWLLLLHVFLQVLINTLKIKIL